MDLIEKPYMYMKDSKTKRTMKIITPKHTIHREVFLQDFWNDEEQKPCVLFPQVQVPADAAIVRVPERLVHEGQQGGHSRG